MAAKKVLWGRVTASHESGLGQALKAKKTGGFTLLELVIALAVLMLVSGSVFLALRPSNHRAIRSAALTLQADLRYAQRLAVIEGRRVDVLLERAHNRYRIIYGYPDEVEIRRVYFQDGVRLMDIERGNRVFFHPRGTPNYGNTIFLRHGRYDWRLTIVPSGGRVAVRQYREF